MRYTIAQLLAFMKKDPSIFGWNAIVAYDRTKANKVLAQEYIERFSVAEGFMPVLTGAVPITPTEIEYVYDYLMDAPRLSFLNSSITSAKALLTMRVLGGSQFTIATELGRGAAVNKVAEYDALQAIPHTMDVDLTTTDGEVDEGGKVVLYLYKGIQPRLYFGPTEEQRKLGGEFILGKIISLDPMITTFTLNEIGSQEGQFLKVEYFEVRTHKEPGSTLAHAENAGEGAVLTFISMEGEVPGSMPVADDLLKFLIPQGDFSSTTVLGQKFLIKRILVDGLKKMAEGSAFAYTQKETNGFITEIEVTQGQYKGPPINSSSPSFSKIAMSGFVLPMIKTSTNDFSLSVVEDETLQIDWSGSAEQACTVAPPGGSDIMGRVVASWKFSMKFEFQLLDEDGELILKPIPGSKLEQLKIAPGTLADHPSAAGPFKEVADILEPRLSAELSACMETFAAVVSQIDTFRLNSLMFKGENVVRFTRADFPGDLALFGILAPKVGVFDIHPLEYVIGQGGSFTFTIVPALPVGQTVTWSVEKVEGYTGYAGGIDQNGRYTAPVKSELDEHGLHFIRARIKATAGSDAVAYALVTVVTRPVSINPLVTTCNASSTRLPQTREFAAGALAPGELMWRVAGNSGASFAPSTVVEGGQTFTAGYKDDNSPVAYTLDEVVVTDSEGTEESSWVLVVHKQQLGEVKIIDNPALSPGQIQFAVGSEDGDITTGITWTLLKGNGEINQQTGVYTVNTHGSFRFALIAAYMDLPFMDMNCYYILPLPLVELPVLLDILDRSNIYFKAAEHFGVKEAARLAGFNQD